MDNLVYCLGPDGRYLFSNGKLKWHSSNLSSHLVHALYDWDSKPVMGSFGDTAENFAVLFRSNNSYTCKWCFGADTPASLTRFLSGKTYQAGQPVLNRALRCVLGPGQSFCAWDDTTYVSDGIPIHLKHALDKIYHPVRLTKARLVAFNGQGGWVLVTTLNRVTNESGKRLLDSVFSPPINRFFVCQPKWEQVVWFTLDATTGTKWIAVSSDTYTTGRVADAFGDLRRCAWTYASADVLNFYMTEPTERFNRNWQQARNLFSAHPHIHNANIARSSSLESPQTHNVNTLQLPDFDWPSWVIPTLSAPASTQKAVDNVKASENKGKERDQADGNGDADGEPEGETRRDGKDDVDGDNEPEDVDSDASREQPAKKKPKTQ